jgi:hypothetical protein
MLRQFLVSVCVVVTYGLCPTVARAQGELGWDVAVSYVSTKTITYGNTYPHGWLLAGGVSMIGARGVGVGVNAEVGTSYDHSDAAYDPELNASFRNYMAGPRLLVQTPHVAPFAQLLLGSITVGCPMCGYLSKFAWQPGGGVDIHLAKSVWLRAQGDFRRIPVKPASPLDHLDWARFAIGVAVRR